MKPPILGKIFLRFFALPLALLLRNCALQLLQNKMVSKALGHSLFRCHQLMDKGCYLSLRALLLKALGLLWSLLMACVVPQKNIHRLCLDLLPGDSW